MTEPAENPTTEGTPAPAAGELMIPKYRLDEAAAEIRRLRESEQLKDRLYAEDRQRMSAQAQPQALPDLTPEETGLDPQLHQAVVKTAKVIADRVIAKERAMFNQQLGYVATRAEKAELLASKGSDKAKYFPDIQKKQMEHMNLTGSYMPAETALELLLSNEKDEKIRQLEAKLAGKTADPVSPPDPARSAPSAAGTRQLPTGGSTGSPAKKTFSELTVEEMEAQIEERARAGERF